MKLILDFRFLGKRSILSFVFFVVVLLTTLAALPAQSFPATMVNFDQLASGGSGYSGMVSAATDTTVIPTKESSSDLEPDSTQLEKERGALLLGAILANNAGYYGQTSEESIPYTALLVSWQRPSGFYVNGFAYSLLNSSVKVRNEWVSAVGATAGWSWNLGKKWSADLSYGYTYFTDNSAFVQAANAHMASAALTREGKINLSAEFDYAFGIQQDFFTTLSAFKTFKLEKFLSKSATLSLVPKLAVTGGTQRFFETYLTEKRVRDSLLGLPLRLPGSGSGTGMPGGIGGIIGGGNGTGNTNNSTTESTTIEKAAFDLLSYNFELPIQWTRASYLLEFKPSFSVLGTNAAARTGNSSNKQVNQFYTFSFYYQF
jgi:hypothetical protein